MHFPFVRSALWSTGHATAERPNRIVYTRLIGTGNKSLTNGVGTRGAAPEATWDGCSPSNYAAAVNPVPAAMATVFPVCRSACRFQTVFGITGKNPQVRARHRTGRGPTLFDRLQATIARRRGVALAYNGYHGTQRIGGYAERLDFYSSGNGLSATTTVMGFAHTAEFRF